MSNDFIDWTYRGVFPSGIDDLVYSFYGRRGVVPGIYSPYPAGTIHTDTNDITTPGGCEMVCYAVNTTSYQWEISRDGITYTTMAGETANILNQFYSHTVGTGGEYYYRCICTGYAGQSTTNPVKIKVSYHTPSALITSDKTIITAPDGIILSVSASQYATSYQWMKDGVDIPGATGTTYPELITTPGVYRYACKASGLGGTVTSNEITVTAQAPIPTVHITPESSTVKQDETIQLTATAINAETYQWKKLISGSWENIVGAISSTYTPPAEPEPVTNVYCCVVTGHGMSATSNSATINTEIATPTVTLFPSATTVKMGSLVTFTVTLYPSVSASVIQHWTKPAASSEWVWVDIGTTTAQQVCTAIGTEKFRAVATNHGITAQHEVVITVTPP